VGGVTARKANLVTYDRLGLIYCHERNSRLEDVTPTGVRTCREGRIEVSSPASRLTTRLTYVGRSCDWHGFEVDEGEIGTKSETGPKETR
jgi:hypothetical protein